MLGAGSFESVSPWNPPEIPPEVPSHFIPGTFIQYAWDSTSIGYLKTCPRLYQYIIIEGWSSTEESIHLRFGLELHKALEDFDRAITDGASRPEALRKVLKELLIRTKGWETDEDTKAGKYKNRRTLVRTLIDYIDHYANDAAETYIKRDETPAVELSFSFELDWGPAHQGEDVRQPYLLCGHLDKVVNFADDLYVKDVKTTTTTLGDYFFDQFDPNNQMTLYSLAAQVVLGATIKGVIIDGVQLMVDSSRFVRGITYRNADRLDEWLKDLKVILREAEGYAREEYWPQRDTSCDKYGGCRFRQVCTKAPGVREKFLKSRFTQLPEEERWNPLKPR